MTAAQKKNVERFKKAAAEAKKLRKKNPKLTQAQAVKQAFAILYKTGKVAGSKKTATKKLTRKKATAKNYHKDTKSHNVRISVVSGVPKSDIDFWVKMFAPRPKKLQLEWYRNLVSSFKTGHFDIFTPKVIGEAQLRALEYILNKKPLIIK